MGSTMDGSRDLGNIFSPDLYGNSIQDGAVSLMDLPLNLLALIIIYLDDVEDISHVSRTCRVLHYMSLPQLYSKVTLKSFSSIQKCRTDGRPRGCGMASPFVMALHGLALRNVGNHVRHFRLHGQWRQPDLEDHSRVGLVPDSDIMLNCLVRVAVEKMPAIHSFSWELDTKMLSTMWQGLAQTTVSHLTVKFSTLRTPRPIALAPAMQNLRSLRLLDIDPLCYVDDVSLLIAQSKNLEDLTLSWHPRMKETREPSISLDAFFGRAAAMTPSLPLKNIAVKNLYTLKINCDTNMPKMSLKGLTMISSITSHGDEAGFFEASWKSKRHVHVPSFKYIRVDKVNTDICDFLASFSGLESLYLVCPLSSNSSSSSSPSRPYQTTTLPHSPASSNANSPFSSAQSISPTATLCLKEPYISTILAHHGSTLKHLLLLPQWRLTADEIAKIFHGCPNLEQLGIGVDFENWPNLRLLSPFMTKLKALRLLDNPLDNGAFRAHVHTIDVDELHEKKLGHEQLYRDKTTLRWIELADLLFQLGAPYPCTAGDGSDAIVHRRKVKKRPRHMVEDWEIWKYSTMEV